MKISDCLIIETFSIIGFMFSLNLANTGKEIGNVLIHSIGLFCGIITGIFIMVFLLQLTNLTFYRKENHK